MSSIIFNDKSNDDLHLKLLNTVSHDMSSYDVEQVEVDGRDGVLLVDKQRLRPVERPFDFVLKADVLKSLQGINEWLNVKGWHDLELSWDSGYLYRATVINQLSVEEVIRQFGKLRVVFLLHPIKLRKDSLQSQSIANGSTITNRGNVPAKPIIELTGSGNTVITINGRRTPLEDIQGSIKLDMYRNIVTSGNLSAWEKVLYEDGAEKPYLEVGTNRISWTGNFTMSITTMEGVRV